MSEFHSNLILSHRYRNAPVAIDWLSKVFGFERHAVYEGENGSIAHAELTLGGNEMRSCSIVVPDQASLSRFACPRFPAPA
jgi:uncharacterized glyoxalase superfamily protein PhnB